MKALFVYKYLTAGGGCESVIRARLDGLPAFGIETHAWFLMDLGGKALFSDCDHLVRVGDVGELRRHLDREDFDLVSTIDTEEIFPLWRQDPDLPPLVIEAHSAYSHGSTYLKDLEGLVPAALLTPSKAHADSVRSLLPDGIPVRVAANPLRSGFLAPLDPFEPKPSRPVLAWVGRLDSLKDWRLFLEIGRACREKNRELDLWMVGREIEAATVDHLRRSAESLGVFDALRWFRGLPYHVMPRFFDAVHASGGVTLSTSKAESFGLVVAESLARGCPAVAPHIQAFENLLGPVADQCLYPRREPDCARRCIETLMNDSEERARVSRWGRRMVEERFSPDVTLADLATALRDSLTKLEKPDRVHPTTNGVKTADSEE